MKTHILPCCLAVFIILPAVLAGAEPAEKGRRPNPWRPAPPRVICDGSYAPSFPCSRTPVHPYGYPCGYYPPCCRPNTPWYEKEPPNSAGRLAVVVAPVHAQVYVDGHPLKRRNDLVYEAGLLSGQYKIEVQAKGYKSHEQRVRIRSGERLRLTIRLHRPASPTQSSPGTSP